MYPYFRISKMKILRVNLDDFARSISRWNKFNHWNLSGPWKSSGSIVWGKGNCIITAVIVSVNITEITFFGYKKKPPNKEASYVWGYLLKFCEKAGWLNELDENELDELLNPRKNITEERLIREWDIAIENYERDPELYETGWKKNHRKKEASNMTNDLITDQLETDWSEHLAILHDEINKRVEQKKLEKKTPESAAADFFENLKHLHTVPNHITSDRNQGSITVKANLLDEDMDPSGGKYGTNRDLTIDDVRIIVARCKMFTEKGGKVTEFYRLQNITPGNPKSYELETLRSWLKKSKFAPKDN